MSFCEAPTIGKALRVSKDWRNSILSSQGLFRRFKMRGKCQDVQDALKLFNRQTNNRILEFEIEIFDDYKSQIGIDGIGPNISWLQRVHMNVSDGQDWALTFMNLLEDAPQLKVLKSTSAKGDIRFKNEWYYFPKFSRES